VTATTQPVDLWEYFLPVPLLQMLEVVKENACRHQEKAEYYTMDGLKCFMGILHSAAQFKVGTGLWSKKRKGMVPALNFGHVMSHDRFDRWFRYLSE